MSTSRGIFDQYPAGESNGHPNPFSFAAEAPVTNPFAAAPTVPQSPFSAIPDAAQDRSVPEPGKPAKIPAPRGKAAESPFQMASGNGHHFGFEAPQPSPFSIASSPREMEPVESVSAPLPMMQNPFSIQREVAAPIAPSPIATPSLPYGAWPQVETPAAAVAPVPAPVPSAPAPVVSPPIYREEAPVFRQLELRAIFGVDREMSAEEILQRARVLPGVKHVARIASQDVMALENLKNTLQSLGFSSGALRLYTGSVPIEFIREGATILAVQTDGGFAPGIRETIMIVTRELDRMGSAAAY
jgi:hypothetical protein